MPASDAPATGLLAGLSNDLADAVEAAGRSVVAIHARRRIPSSGVCWRPGVVVAAHHTITRDDDIGIALPDGRTVTATLAGRDAGTDLAVLRLPDDALPAEAVARTSASTPLRVGSLVLALGRPGPSVTASLGIVSAIGEAWRTWQGGRIDRLVRLDLAIYDGFSGGPLVAPGGEVVGLNTSGLARAVALTIPVSTVDRVVEQLLARGHVPRGFLGVATQPVRLPEALHESLGLAAGIGLVVVSLETGGPADTAGILLGDILVTLDGRAVEDPGDVLAALAAERIGQTLQAGVLRAGRLETVAVTVGERPARAARPGRRGR
jgi:S1-C subfamily serine protease